MASDSEASCVSDPNFAVICSFLERFSTAVGISHPTFAELQEMLENVNEVPDELVHLHVKLLRKAKKSVTFEKWEKALVKFCHTYSNQDGWEIERFGYKKARIGVKLQALKALLEGQFDVNAKFKSNINLIASEELRLQPLGKDKTGLSYWAQFDPASNIRVYKEDLDEETWTVVASDRVSLVNLIQELSGGVGIDTNLLNEDSSSLGVDKPVTDTGQDNEQVSEGEQLLNGSGNIESEKAESVNNTNSVNQAEEEKKEQETKEIKLESDKKTKEEENEKRRLSETADESDVICKKPKLDVDVSEAVEEPVLLVKGEGSGKDCETGYRDGIVSEVIEEDVMYFRGEGYGYECDTGNPENAGEGQQTENKVNDVDNVNNKLTNDLVNNKTTDNNINHDGNEDKTGVKVWSIDTICGTSEEQVDNVTSDNQQQINNNYSSSFLIESVLEQTNIEKGSDKTDSKEPDIINEDKEDVAQKETNACADVMEQPDIKSNENKDEIETPPGHVEHCKDKTGESEVEQKCDHLEGKVEETTDTITTDLTISTSESNNEDNPQPSTETESGIPDENVEVQEQIDNSVSENTGSPAAENAVGANDKDVTNEEVSKEQVEDVAAESENKKELDKVTADDKVEVAEKTVEEEGKIGETETDGEKSKSEPGNTILHIDKEVTGEEKKETDTQDIESQDHKVNSSESENKVCEGENKLLDKMEIKELETEQCNTSQSFEDNQPNKEQDVESEPLSKAEAVSDVTIEEKSIRSDENDKDEEVKVHVTDLVPNVNKEEQVVSQEVQNIEENKSTDQPSLVESNTVLDEEGKSITEDENVDCVTSDGLGSEKQPEVASDGCKEEQGINESNENIGDKRLLDENIIETEEIGGDKIKEKSNLGMSGLSENLEEKQDGSTVTEEQLRTENIPDEEKAAVNETKLEVDEIKVEEKNNDLPSECVKQDVDKETVVLNDDVHQQTLMSNDDDKQISVSNDYHQQTSVLNDVVDKQTSVSNDDHQQTSVLNDVVDKQTLVSNDVDKQTLVSIDVDKQIPVSNDVDKQTSVLNDGIDKQTLVSNDVDKQTFVLNEVDKQTLVSNDVEEQASVSIDVDKEISVSKDVFDKETSVSNDVDKENSVSNDVVDKQTSVSKDVDKQTSVSNDVEKQMSVSIDVDRETLVSNKDAQRLSEKKDTGVEKKALKSESEGANVKAESTEPADTKETSATVAEITNKEKTTVKVKKGKVAAGPVRKSSRSAKQKSNFSTVDCKSEEREKDSVLDPLNTASVEADPLNQVDPLNTAGGDVDPLADACPVGDGAVEGDPLALPSTEKIENKAEKPKPINTRKRRSCAQRNQSDEGKLESDSLDNNAAGGKRKKVKQKRTPDMNLRRSVEEKRKEAQTTSDDEDEGGGAKKSGRIKETQDDEKKPSKPKKVPRKPKKTKGDDKEVNSSGANSEVDDTPKKRNYPIAGREVKLLGLPSSEPLPVVRQSRRIAQIKMKEEAVRRQEEEERYKHFKDKDYKKKSKSEKRKRKKKDDSDAEDDDSDEGVDISEKKSVKKKKKEKMVFDTSNPWLSSSGSSSSAGEEEEEEIEDDAPDDEDFTLKSDHEFSPESDLGEDPDYAPMKRARTAKVSDEGDAGQYDDTVCEQCKKNDHPEWILLCDKCDSGWHASCLRPTLMLIPEGDWFCPPCAHSSLIEKLQDSLREYDRCQKQRENEELRRKRLAFVGISLDNVLPSKPHEKPKHEKHDDESDEESSEESGSNSDESLSDSEEEPVYQLRERRTNVTSYRYNEYDELIKSAIQDDIEAGNEAEAEEKVPASRGKDINNIINAEKQELEKKITDNNDKKDAVENAKEADDKEDEVVVKEKPKQKAKRLRIDDDDDNEEKNDKDDDDDDYREENDDEEEELCDELPPVVPKYEKRKKKKKARKLTSLDFTSEEEDPDSDSDFKGSSSSEESEFTPSSDSDDSFSKKRRKNKEPIRRSTRQRISRYDRDFINDDSEDDAPRRKKSRNVWASSEESTESDGSWGRKKKKRGGYAPRSRSSKKKSKSRRSRNKKRVVDSDDENDDGTPVVKKPRNRKIKYGGLDDLEDDPILSRRTRGKTINYNENNNSDSSSEKEEKKKKKKEEDKQSDADFVASNNEEEDEFVADREENEEEDESESEDEKDSSGSDDSEVEKTPKKQKEDKMKKEFSSKLKHLNEVKKESKKPVEKNKKKNVIPDPDDFSDDLMEEEDLEEFAEELEDLDEEEEEILEELLEEGDIPMKQLKLAVEMAKQERRRKKEQTGNSKDTSPLVNDIKSKLNNEELKNAKMNKNIDVMPKPYPPIPAHLENPEKIITPPVIKLSTLGSTDILTPPINKSDIVNDTTLDSVSIDGIEDIDDVDEVDEDIDDVDEVDEDIDDVQGDDSKDVPDVPVGGLLLKSLQSSEPLIKKIPNNPTVNHLTVTTTGNNSSTVGSNVPITSVPSIPIQQSQGPLPQQQQPQPPPHVPPPSFAGVGGNLYHHNPTSPMNVGYPGPVPPINMLPSHIRLPNIPNMMPATNPNHGLLQRPPGLGMGVGIPPPPEQMSPVGVPPGPSQSFSGCFPNAPSQMGLPPSYSPNLPTTVTSFSQHEAYLKQRKKPGPKPGSKNRKKTADEMLGGGSNSPTGLSGDDEQMPIPSRSMDDYMSMQGVMETPPKRKGRGRGKKQLAMEAARREAMANESVAAHFSPQRMPTDSSSVITRMLNSPQNPQSGPPLYPGPTPPPNELVMTTQIPFTSGQRGRPPAYRQQRPPGMMPQFTGPGRPPLTATSPGRMRAPVFHTSHHPLDPSPSGGGPINLPPSSSPLPMSPMKPQSSTPPSAFQGPPQAPPGSAPSQAPPPGFQRFPTEPKPPFSASPTNQPPRPDGYPFGQGQPNFPYGQFQPPPGSGTAVTPPATGPVPGTPTSTPSAAGPPTGAAGGASGGGEEETAPPASLLSSPFHEQQFEGSPSAVPLSDTSNSKSYDEDTGGGEFGGLASYFASQREDDLDT